MQTIRIFISSPGDVAEERDKAKRVIDELQRHYGSEVTLQPVLWEDLAIPATGSFQPGIDFVLPSGHRVDVAVFILWSRLGPCITKPDGTPYSSGTGSISVPSPILRRQRETGEGRFAPRHCVRYQKRVA